MGLPQEIRDRFMAVDPATFGHFPGVGFMSPQIKPISKRSKMVGPACTVRLEGRDSCALYHALKNAPRGAVIVVDRCGDNTFACVGEMLALVAESRGLAGIVIDGPATDSVAIEKSGYPVFCTGISVVTTLVLGISGERDIPVSCGGAVVRPGDIVFGDADGVVVVPPEGFLSMLLKAEEQVVREVEMRRHFKAGGFPRIDIERLSSSNVMGIIDELKKVEGP
jgi:4-hydroxy-4-methyl-2-oxoglutarate aldolase